MSRDGRLTSKAKKMLARALEASEAPQKSQNATFSEELSPDQTKAMAVLLRGGTQSEAAAEAGVARETVSRWLHRDPLFMSAYQNTRAELASQVRIELASLGRDAVGAIRETLSQTTDPALRFRAACKVLSFLVGDRPEAIKPTTADDVETGLKQEASDAKLRKFIASLGD
jgi:hypothetical protein